MFKKSTMDKFLKPLPKNKRLTPGMIIRRTGDGKDQQGSFFKYTKDGGMVLINIIDLKSKTLFASKGILKPKPEDRLYYYESSFAKSPAAEKAYGIVKKWPLFQESVELQEQILNFVRITYAPEQIIAMSKEHDMAALFAPIQEEFRIGRFSERRSPERVCNEVFLRWLESLQKGKHITYVALVFSQKQAIPRFYSIGTKPHQETEKELRRERFNFPPNQGGHIKSMGVKEGAKHFLVDAGSNYFGRGIHTPLHVSDLVVRGLKKVYPDMEFTPAAGRGAFGTEQSY
jgi:hypothetical protein